MTRALLLAPLLVACATASHPELLADSPPPTSISLDELLARPGLIEHEEILSARWHVPLRGLLNLQHPVAREAGLVDEETDIVIPVHALRHPVHGLFIVDTGVAEESPARGLVRGFLEEVRVVSSTRQILQRIGAPDGVLLTHFHLDHVLGLPDVPRGTPIYLGAGELGARNVTNFATRSTFQKTLKGHSAIRNWDFARRGVQLGPIARAIDVFGDGSLWALQARGHTPGTTAYLALTTRGPALFTGDVSHTRWGFENGVEPGEYTADHEENARALEALRALKRGHPALRVYVGHELGAADLELAVRVEEDLDGARDDLGDAL